MFKNILKEFLIFLHLDLSKNIKYDRLTRAILKKFLSASDNCIDVGCHKGEILDLMLSFAPKGTHFAFEPLPHLFESLKTKYTHRAHIFPYALSYSNGETTFQFVRNDEAYSGIKKRKYAIHNPDIAEITVAKRALDDVIGPNQIIHFIKIDVEGGEFDVIKGAKNLLKQNKPMVLFECGKGASDFYGTSPLDLYNYLHNDIGLQIYTLESFLKVGKPVSGNEFINHFELGNEYYFIAS
ncbi:FkbM family methyltransferase [Pedobacter arcticus]|uniref:FkbM family methyltransferase n=1 Tax=Pedobacter arcticus TaxID=752140 RepID=UPI0002F483D2|nr:FkbM family methyltransferase [Pedobacter arcticus]